MLGVIALWSALNVALFYSESSPEFQQNRLKIGL